MHSAQLGRAGVGVDLRFGRGAVQLSRAVEPRGAVGWRETMADEVKGERKRDERDVTEVQGTARRCCEAKRGLR